MTPLSELESSIARKVASASFPPGTASKRFARSLEAGYVKELSDRGRRFLAFVAHKYRRQYALTEEEVAWVADWKDREIVAVSDEKQPTHREPGAQEDTAIVKLREWEAIYGRRA